MTPVFAYYADAASRKSEPDTGLFDRLATRAVQWFDNEIGGRFSLIVDGEERFWNPIVIVASRRKPDAQHELFSVEYKHPSRDRTLLYRLNLEIVRVPQGVQFAVALAAHTLITGMVELRVVPYLPGLLVALAEVADFQVLGETVPFQAKKYEERFIGRLIDEFLISTSRVLPIVALSPHPETGQPIVDTTELVKATFGLCHVADLLTKQATFEISNRLGREWSCYNGAVRIYWPNITANDGNFLRHPLYFPEHYPEGSQAQLCDDIFRRLAAAALVKFATPPKLKIFRQAEERHRQQRENARIAELTAGVEAARELTDLLNKLRADNLKLREDLELSKIELAENRDQITARQGEWQFVERQISEANAAADRERRRAEALAHRFVPKIASVAEAIAYAREDCGGLLEFLPSALRSAEESPYKHPDQVYRLFRALAEIMSKVRATGHVGTGLFEEMKKYGFDYKDKISTTAATKYREDYVFRYEGRERLFENHVTRGSGHPESCISIHWIRDETRQAFVFAWCGKHLRNTMS